MVSENSLKNLIPIPAKKGEIRNPNGRPLGSKNRKTILKEWMSMKTSGELDGKTLGNITLQDKMILAMYKEACNGNVNAFNTLMDGIHGKIPTVNVNENIETPKVNLNLLNEEELNSLSTMYDKLKESAQNIEIIEG